MCSGNNFVVDSMEDTPHACENTIFVPGTILLSKVEIICIKCIVSLCTEYIYVYLHSRERNKTR